MWYGHASGSFRESELGSRRATVTRASEGAWTVDQILAAQFRTIELARASGPPSVPTVK
jgi:hypothetical protein